MTSQPQGVAGSSIDRATAWLGGLRPIAFAIVVFAAVIAIYRWMPSFDPTGPLGRYSVEAMVLFVVGIGALASWSAVRRGASWDADLWPALLGGIAGFTLLTALAGSQYAPGGLLGDQEFRTETLTRFADAPALADFTYRGLPAFYAPAWFWVLGRFADVAGIDAWRLLKYATVATAMVVPILSFLLWRRQLSVRTAAVIAAVSLAVENFYEPYAWLVLIAFVPWWLESIVNHTRPGVRSLHPVVLGLIGAVLALTYYYLFLIAAVATLLYLAVELVRGALVRADVVRIAIISATVLAATAVFWLPLAASMLQAGPFEAFARYLGPAPAAASLTFLDPGIEGALALVGLGFLLLTASQETLSRALLVFLAAAYAWFIIAWPASLLDHPLLTFRSLPVASMVLLIAGVIGLARIGRVALAVSSVAGDAGRRSGVRTIVGMLAVAFILTSARGFSVDVITSPLIPLSHNQPLPDGRSQRWAEEPVGPDYVSVGDIQVVINRAFRAASDPPVVLSFRTDVMSLNPYYGFLQHHVYYSHPASSWDQRVTFLSDLATVTSPAEFARRTTNNPFDRIDAFVLRDAGDGRLVFDFRDDDYPDGSVPFEIAFHAAQFDPAVFQLADLGDVVVVTRR